MMATSRVLEARSLMELIEEARELRAELDRAHQALSDLATGDADPPCLFAEAGRDGPACDPASPCNACLAAGRVDVLTRQRDEARATAAQLRVALEMVRDADDDRRAEGLATLPAPARQKIDDALARARESEKPADETTIRSCRICGCSDQWGCDGGCSWVGEDLCRGCAPEASAGEGGPR